MEKNHENIIKREEENKRKKWVFELFSFDMLCCCFFIRNILFIDLDTIYFDYEEMHSSKKIRKIFEM